MTSKDRSIFRRGLPLGLLASSSSSSCLTADPLVLSLLLLFDLLRFVSGSCCSESSIVVEADRLFADDRVDLVVGGVSASSSCKAAAIAAAVAGSGSVPRFLVVVVSCCASFWLSLLVMLPNSKK